VKTKYIKFVGCCLFSVAALLAGGSAYAGKRKESPCSKPPKVISRPPLPKEEQERAKRIRAQGSIEMEIGEDGNVAEAKVVNASSKDAAEILLDMVKGMKFEPRSGCGPFKTTLNFTLSE